MQATHRESVLHLSMSVQEWEIEKPHCSLPTLQGYRKHKSDTQIQKMNHARVVVWVLVESSCQGAASKGFTNATEYVSSTHSSATRAGVRVIKGDDGDSALRLRDSFGSLAKR
jgi:hypothetical protein